jgi:hypothetical protein
MYGTSFPHGPKVLQLERRVVFEIGDVGRIHRQALLDVVWMLFGSFLWGMKKGPDKLLEAGGNRKNHGEPDETVNLYG